MCDHGWVEVSRWSKEKLRVHCLECNRTRLHYDIQSIETKAKKDEA